MSEHSVTDPAGPATAHATQYERKDINLRPIVIVGGILVVIGIVVHLVSWWVFDFLQTRDRETKLSPFPLAVMDRNQLPSERLPRLEEIDRMEVAKKGQPPTRLYDAELRRLDSYGWDEKTQRAHIPIERAMKIIVEKQRLRTREP